MMYMLPKWVKYPKTAMYWDHNKHKTCDGEEDRQCWKNGRLYFTPKSLFHLSSCDVCALSSFRNAHMSTVNETVPNPPFSSYVCHWETTSCVCHVDYVYNHQNSGTVSCQWCQFGHVRSYVVPWRNSQRSLQVRVMCYIRHDGIYVQPVVCCLGLVQVRMLLHRTVTTSNFV